MPMLLCKILFLRNNRPCALIAYRNECNNSFDFKNGTFSKREEGNLLRPKCIGNALIVTQSTVILCPASSSISPFLADMLLLQSEILNKKSDKSINKKNKKLLYYIPKKI